MTATAKVFSTGNSQAVRLPKAFRVSAKEMWITKNEVTGEITLKPIAGESSLDRLFRLIDEAPLPADFLAPKSRRNDPPRNSLEIAKARRSTVVAVKRRKRA